MSDLTLIPVYSMDWEDGGSRRTDDEDAFEDVPSPDAVEGLAEQARQDDECEVELVSMASQDEFL